MYMHLKVYLTSTDCQVTTFPSTVEARGRVEWRPLPIRDGWRNTSERLKGV